MSESISLSADQVRVVAPAIGRRLAELGNAGLPDALRDMSVAQISELIAQEGSSVKVEPEEGFAWYRRVTAKVAGIPSPFFLTVESEQFDPALTPVS